MEILRRHGGTAGALMALAGAGIAYFAPDYRWYGWIVLGLGAVLTVVALTLNADDLRNLVMGRPFRHGANALFYSLVVLAIAGALNFLAARHNRRFDMTAEGVHSLSPQTIQILKGLDEDVTVAAFYSPTVGGRQQATDLLDEYKYQSPRINVRVIDPDRSPGEARAYNIEQYGTLVVSTKTGEARITPATLREEDLTNAIVKATAKAKSVVCVLTGHGEKRPEDAGPEGLQQAAEALRKENFEVKEVRLLEAGATLTGCRCLVVAGPSRPLLAPEVEAVEAYVKGGGRLLVLREPRTPTGLEPLLQSYGLKAGEDFVVDVNPMGRLVGGSPAAPVIYEYGSHVITKDLQGLASIFPTVGSVETMTPTVAGVTTDVLAKTSAQSWAEMGEMADQVSFDSSSEKAGPLAIGATATRKSEQPADPNAASEPGEGAPAATEAESRLVLFGDAEYATNKAFGFGGNRDILLNSIAWLSESSDLISVRPKSRASQPVVMSALQARALTWYGLAVSPLVMAAAGLGVYFRRRRL